MKVKSLLFIVFFALGSIACSSENLEEDLFSESKWIIDAYASKQDISAGAINAVKKARQMTDLQFTPIKPIHYNIGTYNAGTTYKGLIYSSTKEIGTSVGDNISFYTLMTAIHNPRSKLYIEQINKPPYHGSNCKAYYGTVCSGLVSYALGLSPNYASYDFPVSDLMEEINILALDSIQVADILWESGHVALITNLEQNNKGYITAIEISEAVQDGCRRYMVTREKFEYLMRSSFRKVFRYKELYKNTSYIPCPEFVAVMDEPTIAFTYNNDLCVDKGDKSCYLENDSITINTMHPYDYIEIYKDDILFNKIDSGSEDIILKKLPYGNYKARMYFMNQYSFFTHWKVVNINISTDRTNNMIFFSSANSIPFSAFFSSISGDRKYPYKELYNHCFTDEEKTDGYVIIPSELTKTDCPYVSLLFSTEYGMIKSIAVNWFK